MGLVQKDVRGDGSCFLRAVYRAALESDPWEQHLEPERSTLLRRFKQALPVGASGSCDASAPGADVVGTSDNEDAFVACARASLAAFLRTKQKFRQVHETLAHLDAETGKLVLESQPEWLREAWNAGGDAAAFQEDCLAKIRDPTNWFGETEVAEFVEVAASWGFTVRIVHGGSAGEEELRAPVNDMARPAEALYLVNVREAHYNYFGPSDYQHADATGYWSYAGGRAAAPAPRADAPRRTGRRTRRPPR